MRIEWIEVADPGVAVSSLIRQALQTECAHCSVRGRRQAAGSAASSHSNVSMQMGHSGESAMAAAAAGELPLAGARAAMAAAAAATAGSRQSLSASVPQWLCRNGNMWVMK